MRLKNKTGTAIDSLLLTFVRLVTASLGIIITKLLSTQFSLQEYGTYSQANLIVATITSMTILGLSDATNYFYNASIDEETKKKNIATIFGIQYIVGVVAAILIMIFQIPIIRYFKNEELKNLMVFIAILPVFENILPMLQVLFISIGQAKLIALRNFWVSVVRLLIIVVACFVTKSIRTIFAILLVLDIVQVVIFMKQLSSRGVRIQLKYFSRQSVPMILKFCIPMAVYVLVNSLNRDIDKYIITYFTDTETLGIYSNAARLLPFDMIVASFITVLIPIITRQIKQLDYEKAFLTLKIYLKLSYYTSWIFVVAAIINAERVMLLLYDKKYLAGLPVFIIYLLVDMFRLMGTTLVIVAKGKTKLLMRISLIVLGANFVFNIISFLAMGVVGPAFTTLIVTIFLTVILLFISAKELNNKFRKLWDCKELFVFSAELVGIAIIFLKIDHILEYYINSPIVMLVISAGAYISILLLLNAKKIIKVMREINSVE